MITTNTSEAGLVPWKHYLTITLETMLAFYLATFSLAMFFIHRGPSWIMTAIPLGLLYLFVIFVCGKRILDNLSIAALMLVIPIAPLLALIMVVSLIPLLEMFK